VFVYIYTQGGLNMTGTDCVQTSHSLSRSYLNYLVYVASFRQYLNELDN
jgi:hypothetical protein